MDTNLENYIKEVRSTIFLQKNDERNDQSKIDGMLIGMDIAVDIISNSIPADGEERVLKCLDYFIDGYGAKIETPEPPELNK